MNLSTIYGWETPRTTTDDNTFYLEDEPERVHWTSLLDETFRSEGKPRRIFQLPSPMPPSPPRKVKRKLEMGMSFPKRGGGVAACLRSLQKSDSLKQRTVQELLLRTETPQTIKLYIYMPLFS